MKTFSKIQWNKYFDHIYIISRCKNFEKRKILDKRLKELGIKKYQYWYVPDFEFDNSKIFCSNEQIMLGHKRCAFGHYSLWKCIYELEYDNVLIIEDDVAFLKDLNTIQNVLETYKSNNADIYLFDYITSGISYLLASAYAVNNKGLKYLITMHERHNFVCDNYFFDFEGLKEMPKTKDNNIVVYYNIYPQKLVGIMMFTPEEYNMTLKLSQIRLAIQPDKTYIDIDKTLYE